MEVDLIYYRRRWAEEMQASAGALDPRVRDVHLDLARRYDERIAQLERQRFELHLRLVPAA
jgi:hypothetical protein